MARKMRDIATLQRVQKKLGDIPISEAIAMLRDLPLGRPKKWDDFLLREIFFCVEAIKARGLTTSAAWKKTAEFHKLSINVVEKNYPKGRDLYEPIFREFADEVLRLVLNNRPRLKEFVRKIKPTAKKTSIE